MKNRLAGVAIVIAAMAAGAGLWWSGRPAPLLADPTIGPAALYAVSFRDLQGRPQSLGQLQGRVVVLNFWATWCAPCREEMPAFDRLARKWRQHGVAFVGVSQEPPEVIDRFGRELSIGYPLWSGGDETGELMRRLGNRVDGLPFTVILTPSGQVGAAKVGPYNEAQLQAELQRITGKS